MQLFERRYIVNRLSVNVDILKALNIHFILHCLFFMNERQSVLLGNLRFYTAKDLMFGRENTPELENEQFFSQVQ